jgi:hypothetical protein
MRPRPRVVGFLAAGVILLTACAGDGEIDETALETDIATALLPDDPGAITSVDCAVDDPGPGDSLECTVVVGSQDLPVQVRVEQSGVVAVTPEAPLLDGDAAAMQLAETFTEELGIATTVTCSEDLVVLTPDAEFECVATDDKGVERSFVVTVGAGAALEIELSQPATGD